MMGMMGDGRCIRSNEARETGHSGRRTKGQAVRRTVMCTRTACLGVVQLLQEQSGLLLAKALQLHNQAPPQPQGAVSISV